MVAGIAPLDFIVSSNFVAVWWFAGYSIPWVIIVLSKATIGFPAFLASNTSGLYTNKSSGISGGNSIFW